MPQPEPAPRRAASPRLLAALLVLVLALLGGLWWSGGRGGAGEAALDPGADGAPARSGGGALTLDPPAPAPLPAPALRSGGRGRGASGVGVRLSGAGLLEGRVLERATGVGVAGARVELLALPPAGVALVSRVLALARLGEGVAQRALPVAVAVTEEGGRFSFEGVREGTYYVDVRAPYHTPEAPARAKVLASGAGGPVEVFVRPGGRVRGELRLPDGAPVSGAAVVLVPGPAGFLARARGGGLRVFDGVTDERGRFGFDGVAPGEGYEITAVGAGTTVSHAIDVVVEAGAETFVSIEARRGGTLTGRVLARDPGDEDAEPRPLPGAQVAAVPRGLRDLRSVDELIARTTAVTDAAGEYTLLHVPPGEVDVIAVAAGHVPGLARALRVGELGSLRVADLELEGGPTVRGRVVDSAGQPIPGVRLRWDTFDMRSLGRNGLEISFAPFLTQAVGAFDYPLTDADGRFVAGPFPGDPAYRIEFRKSGYGEVRHRWDPAEEEGEIEVTMRRGGAVEGVVMDLERAEPVTRFTVLSFDRVELRDDAPGRWNPFAGGQPFEDPAGRFRLDPVEPGEVSFLVQADGYVPARLDGIAVAEGETTRGVIVKLEPGGVVRGVVVDSDGGPVPGAHVIALAPEGGGGFGGRRGRGRPRDGVAPPSGGGSPLAFVRRLPPAVLDYATSLGLVADLATQSDQDGGFELVGLDPGPTAIAAFHRDHVPGASETVTVEAGEVVEDVRIELSRGGGVYGRVEDRNGRPLGGSTVVAVAPARFARGGASNIGGGLYQGVAREDGEYRIEHMSGGSYFLLATRGDEALNPLSFLSSFDFDLVTVPADELVRFDIVDAAAGGTRVYGVITDRGEAVRGGSLAAIGFEGDNLLGVDFKLARVDADGSYEFDGIAPGEYQLQLEAAGRRVRLLLDVPDVPELRWDIAVPEGGIEGRVRAAGDGAPVVRAEVLLRPLDRIEASGLLAPLLQSEGQLLRTRTDSDGAYRFERLQEGDYELFVRPRQREGETPLAPAEPLEVALRQNELRRDVDVELHVALALRGRVVDPDGLPVAGARVLALRTDETELRPAADRTDEDGRFSVEGLAPGRYDLGVSAEGFAGARRADVELDADGQGAEELELRLERGVLVTVRVFAATGSPQSGARARLTPTDGRAPAPDDLQGTVMQLFTGEGATDREGRVELGRYAPGRYELTVWRGLSRTTAPDVVLGTESDAAELAVTLP